MVPRNVRDKVFNRKKFEDRMIMLKMQGQERLGLTRYIPEKKT